MLLIRDKETQNSLLSKLMGLFTAVFTPCSRQIISSKIFKGTMDAGRRNLKREKHRKLSPKNPLS